MLAHVRNGQVVQVYKDNNGWITLEDGRKASPPVFGFVDGNDKIVPIVEETQDTSTGPDKVTGRSVIVEVDRVLRLTSIRDMTQEEIDQRQQDWEQRQDSILSDPGVVRVLLRVMLDQENRLRTLENTPSVTEQQFKTWVMSQL